MFKTLSKTAKIAAVLGGGFVMYIVFKFTGTNYKTSSQTDTATNDAQKMQYQLALIDKGNAYSAEIATINVQNRAIDAQQNVALAQIDRDTVKNALDFKLADKTATYGYLVADKQLENQKILGLTDLSFQHDVSTHALNNQLDIANLAHNENLYALESSRIKNQLDYSLQSDVNNKNYDVALRTIDSQSQIANAQLKTSIDLANIQYNHDVSVMGYENAIAQGQFATASYANLLNAGVQNNAISAQKKGILWNGITGTIGGIADIIGNIYGGGITKGLSGGLGGGGK